MFNMIINTVDAATITVTEPAGATGLIMMAAAGTEGAAAHRHGDRD